MGKTYIFAEAVKRSLEEGRKKEAEYKKIEETVRNFGQTVVAQISRQFAVPVGMTIKSLDSQDSAHPSCGLSSIWGASTAMPDTYVLCIHEEFKNTDIPLVKYQINAATCYPCLIQCGVSSMLCSDLVTFEAGLQEAFDARILDVTRQLSALSSEYEASSESSVE